MKQGVAIDDCLRQFEINCNQGLGFDGTSVYQIRLITPLSDSLVGRLSQQQCDDHLAKESHQNVCPMLK